MTTARTFQGKSPSIIFAAIAATATAIAIAAVPAPVSATAAHCSLEQMPAQTVALAK